MTTDFTVQPALWSGDWLAVPDGHPAAWAIFRHHYSCRKTADWRRAQSGWKFVGPGQYMALLSCDGMALFVWRKFIDDSGQKGINCAIFRNEGRYRSSDLIRSACELAWRRWPGERLYTYVNREKIKSSNPGWCFQQAGWRRCGKTKGGLDILEIEAAT